MIGIFIRASSKMGWILLVFLTLSVIGIEIAEADNISFRVIVVNPSKTRTQEVQVKKYLPKEATPDDILELDGLEVEYDHEKSIYYVYKKDLLLLPSEIRIFEVEIEDIWIVPEAGLLDLDRRTDAILAHLKDTEYYATALIIADTIYPRLDEIRTSQIDESISRQRHIGVYRQSRIAIKDIEADLAKMEKLLVTAGGPPAPEMLAETKIKAEAPSKTMTWIAVFVIVIFVGLLGGVLFFTWQRQATLTKETLFESRKSAFPESGSQEKKGDKED